MTPPNKIIEEFKKKYKDYLERAYNEIPDRNLGDEMVSDISRALVTQRKEYEKMIQDLVAKKNKDCRRYIKEEKEATKNVIIREIEEGLPKVGLTKKQSTKIFAEIEEDERKLRKDMAYSAPEVVRQRLKEFYWDLYLRGRIDEKTDIKTLLKRIKQ